MNDQLVWTLDAKCTDCLREISAPLIIGVPIYCPGCGVAVKIDVVGSRFGGHDTPRRLTGAGAVSRSGIELVE